MGNKQVNADENKSNVLTKSKQKQKEWWYRTAYDFVMWQILLTLKLDWRRRRGWQDVKIQLPTIYLLCC